MHTQLRRRATKPLSNAFALRESPLVHRSDLRSSTKEYKYAPLSLVPTLRRRGDGIGENIEKRREEIGRDISWIQEEKFRFSRLPRLVQLCALPSPLSNK